MTGNDSPLRCADPANTVNLPTVTIIKVLGSGNHITWEKGPGGAIPQISNPNGSNTIAGPGGFQSGRS